MKFWRARTCRGWSLWARAFVDRMNPLFPGRLMLLDGRGVLLASSDPADAGLTGQTLTLPNLPMALQGQNTVRTLYSRDRQAEVADVLVPWRGADGSVQAVIRITDTLSTAQQRFDQLRTWIAIVLAIGMLLGAILGLLLALTVERPLLRLTHAVEAFPQDQAAMPSVAGPAEVRVLVQAFQRMGARIRSLEEGRHLLLTNIIHELGRPLGAMQAAARALLDGAAEEPALRDTLLRGIHGEIRRMELLLDELAGLRSLTAGPAPLHRQPVALDAWLDELLAPWQQAALAAGLAWRAELAPGLPVVSIDPERLGQALGNLLSNAIKYTPAPGTVTVTVTSEDAHWLFRVTDTGSGIPVAEQERIFEPFYRTPPERHYPQGLGLGLTIARNLIRAHGGELTLDSCPGMGACFTAQLPRTPLESGAQAS